MIWLTPTPGPRVLNLVRLYFTAEEEYGNTGAETGGGGWDGAAETGGAGTGGNDWGSGAANDEASKW
jgi:hypothetical protein